MMYRHRDLTIRAGPVLILWHVCSSGPHLTSIHEHHLKCLTTMYNLAPEEHFWAGVQLRILGPLDSIFTLALLPSGILRDIPLGRNRDCVPEPVFFPLLPNQIILFQLLKLFSFVCNGKMIFRFGFL